MTNESKPPALVLDQPTPTLFVDYDGTLHRGHGLLDEQGNVSLDSGEPVFEYAPLLASMLEAYPDVEIVLTTRWLQKLSLEQVVSFLPMALAKRVVGTTAGIPARFGYIKIGIDRTYIIRSYVFEKRLRNWLAIDDSVYGAHDLRTDFLDLTSHLVLLDPKKGIGDSTAQRRIMEWLVDVHGNDPRGPAPTATRDGGPP
ncbi:HAD domain-containing protein [Paraburkholderia sp. SIMBA_055]